VALLYYSNNVGAVHIKHIQLLNNKGLVHVLDFLQITTEF